MVALLARGHFSTAAAALSGILVGLAVVCLYFGAGLLIAGWNVSEFLAHLSIDTIGYLLAMVVLAIAFVGLPIAIFLRFNLITPLVVLVVVILGWLIVGAVQGILSLQTIFGLALYAAYLSPVSLVLYAIFGGSEYLFRTKTNSR
ncbi:hypothetical protein [Halomicrococcus sp. NG-SE-24]|uniref:hypothetical protein n=1 Tax=Halomicrococcus sp. NG-SE-24 TaxID=3436928 RepID=UPI003D986627